MLASKLRVIDLFSGIGGFALGLEWAGGFETIRFCENDPFCIDVLKKRFPEVEITEDIHEFRAQRYAADVVVGGFPCQPFSHAGRRQPESDTRNLWPEMRRVINVVRPAWVVCENVTGLVTMGLDDVLADLESSGYSTQTFAIPARAVGAPHRRERIWIVAARVPLPDAERDSLRLERERGGEQRRLPGSAIADDNGSAGCVADADSDRLKSVGESEHRRIGSAQRDELDRRSAGRRRDRQSEVADADSAGLERRPVAGEGSREFAPWACSRADEDSRLARSGIRRVSHGVSRRVDRLRALGNAVVPQIVEEIGRAILKASA